MSKNIFFTSDTHYNHSNIIKYCNRPFKNAYEMNETLISNHNEVVGIEDEIYFLGDFYFRGPPGKAIEILKRLNGRKFMIRGNHDKIFKRQEIYCYFEWVKDYYELKMQDNVKGGHRLIVLCHYPMLTWNKSHHGSIMLHGHNHSGLDKINVGTMRLDVGVDSHNYYPINYTQVLEKLNVE